MPRAAAALAEQATAVVQELRSAELYKTPGVSETLDWVAALVALDRDAVDLDAIEDTLGVLLKAREDVEAMRGERLSALLSRAMARSAGAAEAPMSSLAANLLAFGRFLRALGLDVSPTQARDALTAVAAVGVARRSDVYHALCATLVSRAADLSGVRRRLRRLLEGSRRRPGAARRPVNRTPPCRWRPRWCSPTPTPRMLPSRTRPIPARRASGPRT